MKVFSGDVGGIAQDKNGYMWIATGGGLYRYDGYAFKFYANDPSNKNSLAANHLETVYADREGMIWICNWVHGLDRLDPLTGKFTHFDHHADDAESLSSDQVTTVLEDRDGTLWFGTDGGLDKYDRNTGKFKNYHNNPNDPFSLSCNNVRIIYEDRQGTIWVGTGSVWEDATTNGGGLNRFDKKTGKFIRYLHKPHDPHSLINSKVRAIYEDSRGVFWVGTAGDGLHTMDRKSGTFERHEYDPTHPEKLSRPPLDKQPEMDHISFITEDAVGNIWIGTFRNGLSQYDPKAQKIVHYGNKEGSGGFASDRPWSFCNSKDGVLWIGTFDGILYRVDPYHRNIPHIYFYTGGAPQVFSKDSANRLWIGMDRGLILRNLSTGASQKFFHKAFNQTSLSNDTILSLCRDHHGILWVGTRNGLNRFNAQSKTFTRYENNVRDRAANTILAIEDAGGDSLWVGTGNGLALMNKRTGTFSDFKNNPKDTNTLSGVSVGLLCAYTSGNLLAATSSSGEFVNDNGGNWGLNYFDKKKRTFRHFLKNVVINVLSQDSYGTFWAGTDQGLYTTDNPSKGFRKFTGPGTDVETNNSIEGPVYTICEDNKKNIWVGTVSGIYEINLRSNQSTFLGIDYEIKDVTSLRVYNWKQMQREMYVGDKNGYYVFFPAELTTNPTPPRIVFSGFRTGGKSATPAVGNPLLSSLDLSKRITVKHNQNSFSFEFACFHYSNPERNRVFYKLDNYDQDWLNAGAARTAYYYNVPPGSYVFKIKAASSDGVWAEISIEVTVMPPWWSTWWAYCLYVLLAVVGIWAIVYYHSRSLRRELEHRKKEQQLAEMKQKTAELQQQATELEMQALRAQMNPHFIFNSLNSINRFILQKQSNEATEYLTKFSRLIRMILNSSANTSVSLAEDLEALQLYLELESLRFGKKFCYKIECDSEIDADFVQVPPMLLQPFVENAIWHGLMNKEGEGHLWININREDSTLICTITDDGIGRRRAAELEERSAKHKSMGMKITESRIAMMQKMNGENKSVEVRDLVDADGSAAGTEVVLRIPVLQQA